jgi:sugar phosphate isomerase/epimerase
MDLERTISRRRLLGTAAGIAAVSVVGPWGGAALAQPPGHAQAGRPAATGMRTIPPGRLGIQQWTVRTATGGNPDDITDAPTGFLQVFEALSNDGYRGFEFFNYNQHVNHLGRQVTIPEIREYLDATGLRADGVHRGYGAMASHDQRMQEFEDAHTLGMTYIGTANNPLQGIAQQTNPASHTVANWQQAAERDDMIGAHAAENGLTWYHHNHQHEFRFLTDGSGRRGYEYWVANTDPDLVHVELDIYWAYFASLLFQTYTDTDGVERTDILDPLAFSLQLGKRAALFHVKDGVENNPLVFVNVGEGILPLREFCSAQHPGRGSRYYIAERDNVSPGPGSDAARRMADATVHATNMLAWRG